MVEKHRGVIINISSTPAISGYIKGAPYTVAKAANLGITKHIAAEFGKYGIRCNAIAPGTIGGPYRTLTQDVSLFLVGFSPQICGLKMSPLAQ